MWADAGEQRVAPRIAAEKRAVKKGVVAPTAWLKETGRKRSEMLPPTTVKQNTSASTEIFTSCRRDLTDCLGTSPISDTT